MLTVTKMVGLIAPPLPSTPISLNLSKISPFASKSNRFSPQNVQILKLSYSKPIMTTPRFPLFSLQSRFLHAEACPPPSSSSSSSSSSAGEIHVIVGPMFAGKTTTLLRRIQAETEKGRSVAVIKSNKDTRYGLDSVVTHDGVKLPCSALASLSLFKQNHGPDAYDQLDVIGIDEAQFFEDLYDFCREAADHDGKTVIVAGLDGDYLRRSFGSVLDIIPLANSVTKLTARCEFCGKSAFFTLRKTEETQTELIGGSDIYMPVCRQHYVSGQVVVEAARIVLESQKAQCSSCL